MATFEKRGNLQWRVKVRLKGFPIQTKTFNTKSEACAWAKIIESEMGRGIFISRSAAENTTLTEVIERYIKEVTPLKRCASRERYLLEYIKGEVGSYSLAALRSQDIAKYRDKRLQEGKAGATVVKELNILSHIIDTARKEWGLYIPENPAKLVRRPAIARGRDRRLIGDEEVRLLAACGESRTPTLELLVSIALETAMRLGELLELEWKNIDLGRRVALLPKTKNGEAREVPLSSIAVRILEKLPRSVSDRVFWQWVRPDSVDSAWRRVLKKSDIQNFRFHDLRHEATSRLFEKSLNPMEVSAITGHKTLQMLKRYTHLRAEDLARKLG